MIKRKVIIHEGEEGVLRAEILHFPNVLPGISKKALLHFRISADKINNFKGTISN
jgi:hypothetical protein